MDLNWIVATLVHNQRAKSACFAVTGLCRAGGNVHSVGIETCEQSFFLPADSVQ